jgi:hypothetical protein
MANEKIATKSRSIRDLLKNVREGRFAIPKLQREFVWDGPKAAKLLDSIYRGMPIGSVLIWETAKSNRLLIRENYNVLPAFQDHHKKVWFVIDGQQRLSVLHHVLRGSEKPNAQRRMIYFERVVLSLEAEKDHQQIVYRKPVPKKFISLSEILDTKWRSRIGGLNKGQIRKVCDCRERILTYKVLLMLLALEKDEVKECFLRVNTQGMKITTADTIFSRIDGIDLRHKLHEIRKDLHDGFDMIAEVPVLWALACTKGDPINPRGSEVDQAILEIESEIEKGNATRVEWDKRINKLKHCFGKSVDYLRQNFKTLNHGILYTDYLVSMLALFFFWNGRNPDIRQKNELKKWFWATNVGSRYSGREFLRCIKEDADFFQGLANRKNVKFCYHPQIDSSDIRRAQYSAHSGVGSAFYSLLLIKNPVSLLEPGIVFIPLDQFSSAMANRKNRHHIFPRRLARESGIPVGRYNSICNICLLAAEENQRIGMKRPETYLSEVRGKRNFSSRMDHHLIPYQEEAGLWWRDSLKGFNQFLKCREKLIAKEMEMQAGIKLFRRES